MALRGNLLIVPALLLSLLGTSCRKEIDRAPGVTINDGSGGQGEEGGNGGSEGSSWKKITPAGVKNFNCLEVFNSQLYTGGAFTSGNVKYLAKLNAGQLQAVSSNTIGGTGIYDLHTHEGNLYVGGDFYCFIPSNYIYNFMRCNSAGTYTAINIAKGTLERVNSMTSSGTALLVCGKFSTGGQNTCVTSNIEKLINNTPQGFNGYTEEINNIHVYNSKTYGVTASNKLLVNTGSGWNTATYQSSNPSDKIMDVSSADDSLYFMGSFWKKAAIKSFSTGGNVRQHNVSIAGNLNKFSGMKMLNGKLYAFGTGMMADGIYRSNVLEKGTNGKWKAVGNLKETVNDLEYFNGKLYAATNNGIYEF